MLLNRIRPYLGYSPINTVLPIFSTNYNSLQTSLTKRFRANSILNLNYTFAKALTNSQGETSEPQNNRNIAAEYGPIPFNRKHVFNGNFVYALPFYLNQKGFVGNTLGGWSVSGIISYASGLPLTITTSGVDPGGLGSLATGVAGATARPDQISNPNSNAPRTIAAWFNSAAFQPVPVSQDRGGNAPIGSVTGPGYGTWDLSLLKDVRIVDRVRTQIRAESFNAFNHTNFSGVSTTLENTNFGQVVSAGQARVLQFAVKATF